MCSTNCGLAFCSCREIIFIVARESTTLACSFLFPGLAPLVFVVVAVARALQNPDHEKPPLAIWFQFRGFKSTLLSPPLKLYNLRLPSQSAANLWKCFCWVQCKALLRSFGSFFILCSKVGKLTFEVLLKP